MQIPNNMVEDTKDILKDDEILWRYIDLPKFINLLQTSSLFFSRADKFEDKFEGSFTPSSKAYLKKYYQDNKIDFTYEQLKKALKKSVFINCWHQSQVENMAMWKIYGNSSNALAIKTTVGSLRKQLETHILSKRLSVEKVVYINHFDDPEVDTSKYTNLFIYKTHPFAFENEVRIIADFFPIPEVIVNETAGWELKIKLKELINSIIVSPESPEWFYSLTEDVCEKYDLPNMVQRSYLSNNPI